MPKDLFDPVFGVDESVGPTGLSDDLRTQILNAREAMIAKMAKGQCRSLESYADAVGYVRGLEFALGYAQRKADEQKKIAIEEDEE